MTKQLLTISFFLTLSSAGPAWAQDSKKNPNELERTRGLWDPQTMMKQASDGIAKHYRLSDEQKEFTSKLLTERVTKFLSKHDKKIWPLLMELTQQQFSGKEPSKESAKRFVEMGYPIFEDARAEIMKGQDEFRKILTDQQKKIHDRDLKGLNAQFRQIDKRFESWKSGNLSGRHPFDRLALGPGRAVQIMPNENSRRNMPETMWERYVRDFNHKYRLDGTQQRSTGAVLQDLKDHAGQYRKTHYKELVEADDMVRKAQMAKPFDKQSLDTAKRIRYLRNKPFDDWFEELKSRLEQVPTEKQRAAFYVRNPQLKPKGADEPATPAPAETAKQPSKPTPSADSEKKATSEKPIETKQPPPPKPQSEKGKPKPSDPN